MADKKILIIDDTLPLLDELSSILEMEGFIVEACPSAFKGLEYLRENTPDIIITDMVMPKMSGVEFIETIRRNNLAKGVPIVVLTADNTVIKSDILDKFNIEALLTKPCAVDKLLNVIQTAIDG